MKNPQDSENVEVKFVFCYSVISFLLSGVLVLVFILCEGVSAFGVLLCSPEFLVVAALLEIVKVGLSKLLSGHSGSLRLPCGPIQDTKPVKGPFLRKVWIKGCRFVESLTPLLHLGKGLGVLLVFWALLTYITVCFGAPVTTHWSETGLFTSLLVLLTAYPILLCKGPSVDGLRAVLLRDDSSKLSQGLGPLDRCLYYKTLLSLAGAWVGAFPIPLDWDRDWQVWPISCCLGAAAGSIIANVVGAANFSKANLVSSKRKYV